MSNQTKQNPLIPILEKAKRFLLYLDSHLVGGEPDPTGASGKPRVDVPPPPDYEGTDPFDFSGISQDEGVMKLQFLQLFIQALANHPDKKDQAFEVMGKMMENAYGLNRDEIRLMMVLIEEILFLLDEDDDNDGDEVYH